MFTSNFETSGACERAVSFYRREDISKSEFCDLMRRNQACRITGVTDRWKANEWSLPESGQVNVNLLEQLFGDCTVPVADCKRSEYGSQPKRDMLMKEYLKYWKSYLRPEINEDCWASIQQCDEGSDCLYLKDWHMQRDVPEYTAYDVPTYFASDWLNEYWLGARKGEDDYRFVYIGPQGSWTPLHCDVFGSYSWSGNVCGTKLWLFLAPGEEDYYRDVNGKLAYDMTEIDFTRYPRVQEHRSMFGGPLRVVQNPGEVIFVPSGWHHQVLNMTDTISINHNWFNGFNLSFVFDKLHAAEIEVQEELDFMRGDEEFERQVEVVLRAHHGMNQEDLQEILTYIAMQRMSQPTSSRESCTFDLERCEQYLKDSKLKTRIRTFLSNG